MLPALVLWLVTANFSGNWVIAQDRTTLAARPRVVANLSGILGEKFTAIQNERALTLDISTSALPKPVHVVYNLDGSESRNLNPGPSPAIEGEPIFSRASWEQDRLVIQTRGTALVNGKPQASKRVMWIDADGFLHIERSSEGATTTVSVYKKS